jgi:hypothetical protein
MRRLDYVKMKGFERAISLYTIDLYTDNLHNDPMKEYTDKVRK